MRSEPATLKTFWANSKTAPKKDEGQKRPPQALITEESSGEDSADEAERKRRDKKGAKGKAVHPLPFLSLGRTVPGPGEEYGAEDYVLLPDVFGNMGGKKSKPLPKPSLPLPKEAAAQKGEKPDTGPSAVKLRAPDNEAGGQGISRKGRSPLDAGFMKTAKKGGSDAAMEMVLQVKDPLIQANLTRTLRVTRGEETRSSDSDSPTEDEEEDERAVREERVRANQQQGLEKGREARGRRQADPPESGKELE
jgi:hypothetical protein